ncbi:hypothetical protein N7478_008675 [Penicillium angulare]|uniref:uncharacterized protein n=1 Tax=Penicillium angulare TaxID=116970 RepID=UPI0025419B43|nr:uncharacterized protein N7478_008675 [Penicillium angulare]KAJ5273550.1 hypothetical protein N7478_008675 [Penicillium angulare]
MMLKARREYTKALSETNKGLADIATSDRDDILAAVVLLGMYEVVTCSDGHFIDRWMKHVEGAARLVEYRGLKQLERREGLEIFTQLRLHINTCDIYRKRRSTALYIRLTENAMKYRDENDQIIDLLCLEVIKLADLRASIDDGSIFDPGEIIRKALTIDANLASLFISVPTPWQYQEIENPFSNGPQIGRTVWGNTYHLYGSLRASNMWNNWRSVRILLHELIIETVASLEGCSPGPERRQQLALAAHSRFIASQLVEDICASVPYHLGAGTEDNDQVPLPVTGAGGFCLMWQLLIAANSGLASQDLRSWIMDCLDKIGYSMGINQALAMSQLLRAGKQSESLHLPENHTLGMGRNHFVGLIEE